MKLGFAVGGFYSFDEPESLSKPVLYSVREEKRLQSMENKDY